MGCNKWKEENWDTLIFTILEGNCILMLGPDVAVELDDGKLRPTTEVLSSKLADADEIKEKIGLWDINRYNLAQVSQYYATKIGRNDLLVKVRSFYEKRRGNTTDLHRNLASLPFYLTITSTPDFMLYQALVEQNKQPILEKYNFVGSKNDIVPMGTVDKPLVYHLYGSIDDPRSLVLSENDLLNFLVAVVSKNPPLPHNLLSELQDKDKSILFLGFGFRHWYLRILLQVLQVRSKESRSFALEQFDERTKNSLQDTIFFFSESDYRIQICSEKIDDFVTELKKRLKQQAPSSPLGITGSKVLLRDAPKVFICHASEDKEYASSLYEKLKASGFEPWLDKENLRGGDEWDSVIRKAIKEKIDYFIVLQSKALLEKGKEKSYVNKEINLAFEEQQEVRRGSGVRFIIPVIIDETPEQDSFKDLHSIDLTNHENFNKLVSAINRDQQLRKR